MFKIIIHNRLSISRLYFSNVVSKCCESILLWFNVVSQWCVSMLWVNVVSQCCESMLWVNVVSQSYCESILLWVNVVSQCCETMLWVNVVSQCCESMLWVNVVSQSCCESILLWVNVVSQCIVLLFRTLQPRGTGMALKRLRRCPSQCIRRTSIYKFNCYWRKLFRKSNSIQFNSIFYYARENLMKEQ